MSHNSIWFVSGLLADRGQGEDMARAFDVIAEQLADAQAQWSLGTFGAIAEFMRDAGEPADIREGEGAISVVTPRASRCVSSRQAKARRPHSPPGSPRTTMPRAMRRSWTNTSRDAARGALWRRGRSVAIRDGTSAVRCWVRRRNDVCFSGRVKCGNRQITLEEREIE